MNKKIKISKPIFIIGTGRCGSTIFYKMLSNHPDIGFISSLNVKFPKSLILWSMNTWFGKIGLRLGITRPSEAYSLFNSIFPGYGRPVRTLRASDVSENIQENIRKLVIKILKCQHKERFLYKYTGWSRIGFFNKIFPDCLFIHMVRDGRAVTNSMLNVSWWNGWQGPQNWRWGDLPEKYKKEWEESNKSFSVLAAIEWKMILDEIEESKKEIEPNRFLQIKYENLIEKPIEVFTYVTKYCGLSYGKKFKERISRYKLINTNNKWKKELPKSEQIILTKCLCSRLKKYNYNL